MAEWLNRLRGKGNKGGATPPPRDFVSFEDLPPEEFTIGGVHLTRAHVDVNGTHVAYTLSGLPEDYAPLRMAIEDACIKKNYAAAVNVREKYGTKNQILEMQPGSQQRLYIKDVTIVHHDQLSSMLAELETTLPNRNALHEYAKQAEADRNVRVSRYKEFGHARALEYEETEKYVKAVQTVYAKKGKTLSPKDLEEFRAEFSKAYRGEGMESP